jgi:outer membrane protein OmpA-like peptidoglycan-associated protein
MCIRKIRYVLTLLLLTAYLGSAFAGDVILFRQGETPDPQDIARMLKGGKQPEAGGAPRVRTRGIKMMSEDTPTPQAEQAKAIERVAAPAGTSTAAAPAENSPVTFALQIQFPFNSAQIQPDMKESLDAVAEGIKLVGGMKIVVEGHTDASGAVDYNLILSKRRAEAVKEYLVAHGVPAANLKAVGRGKFEPLVKENPTAPENRRVQFRTAG